MRDGEVAVGAARLERVDPHVLLAPVVLGERQPVAPPDELEEEAALLRRELLEHRPEELDVLLRLGDAGAVPRVRLERGDVDVGLAAHEELELAARHQREQPPRRRADHLAHPRAHRLARRRALAEARGGDEVAEAAARREGDGLGGAALEELDRRVVAQRRLERLEEEVAEERLVDPLALNVAEARERRRLPRVEGGEVGSVERGDAGEALPHVGRELEVEHHLTLEQRAPHQLAQEVELAELGRRRRRRPRHERRAVVAEAVLAVGAQQEERRARRLQLGTDVRHRLAVWPAVVVGGLSDEPHLEAAVAPPQLQRVVGVELGK